MDAYRPRVIEALLKRKLGSAGAILVEGAKWCGKSTTAVQFANSHVYLANPATYRQNMTLAEVNPSALLEGETPRLIDEWQLAPELWDAVRGEVYHYRDSSGLECDAVVHLRNGHYGLVEIKLGGETSHRKCCQDPQQARIQH